MDKPKIADELSKMEYEPLLAVEKQLIVWSIVSGLLLAVLLAWVSRSFLAT
jgi:hypothetical protein